MYDRLRGYGVPLLALGTLVIVFSAVVIAVADERGDVDMGMEAAPSRPLTAFRLGDHTVDARRDGAGTSQGTQTPAVTETPTEVAPTTPTPDPTPDPARDEQYLRQICTATREFHLRFEYATRGIQPINPEHALTELVKALTGPMETLVRDLEAAKPPEGLEQWHHDALERLKQTEEQVKATQRADELGRLTLLFDSPFPRPPEETVERLRKAAERVPECDEVAGFLR